MSLFFFSFCVVLIEKYSFFLFSFILANVGGQYCRDLRGNIDLLFFFIFIISGLLFYNLYTYFRNDAKTIGLFVLYNVYLEELPVEKVLHSKNPETLCVLCFTIPSLKYCSTEKSASL